MFIVNSTILDNLWGGGWGNFDFSVVFLPFKCLQESSLICVLSGFGLPWFSFTFNENCFFSLKLLIQYILEEP